MDGGLAEDADMKNMLRHSGFRTPDQQKHDTIDIARYTASATRVGSSAQTSEEVDRTKSLTWVSTGTQFRLLVALVVAVVAGMGTESRSILPWVGLVAVADLVAARLLVGPVDRDSGVDSDDPDLPRLTGPRAALGRDRTRQSAALTLTVLVAVVAGAALTVGPSALPLAVIPISHAASRWGRTGLLESSLGWLLTAVVVRVVAPPSELQDTDLDLRWLSIALVVGLGAAWLHRASHVVASSDHAANPAAAEAATLLTRLDVLTTDLAGGLDPATSAEFLLDTLGRPGPLARSAVLVGGPEDHPVPLALRGADRVPWGDPLTDPGAVGQAWRGGHPVTIFDPQTHREVRAVPLVASGGARVGVLVQDVMAMTPSSQEDLADLRAAVRRHGPVIGVALSFASLRERAGFEERERLAREMHDGIAQELVALSFHLDLMARTRAGQSPDQAEEMLATARTQLRRILGDLRSHISDLRVSVRPERGLGATMTSRLQSFGTSTGVVVSLRLDESGFRLPARLETVLYRLFLDVLADVKDGCATGVDVDLSVVAPDATLRMRHDGATTFSAATFADHPVTAAGGEVTIETQEGLDLVASFRTPQNHVAPVHVNEKVPQPS